MKVANGFNIEDGIFGSNCPRCDASNEEHPFRITLKPMKVICSNCGLVLVHHTAEEEDNIQKHMIEKTGIPIGGSICDAHEEN